jgi:outer membrane protein assembly factor BamB
MTATVVLWTALVLAPPAAGTAPPTINPLGEMAASDTNSTVNMSLCPQGKWEVMEDQWGKIVRVNMLKITDADWVQVPGVKKAWRMQGFEGEPGMAFHPILSEIKDVDGDGKPDIFRLRSEHAGAQIERLRYDDGSIVWESGPVGKFYGDESRLAVFELNGPKDWCVFYADKNGAYCFDAATGKTRWQHKGSGMFTVGHFLKKDKSAMAIRGGSAIYCLDETGTKVWQYDCVGLKKGGADGHEMMRGDFDGDGLDEIVVNMNNRTLALRGDGKLLWEDKTQVWHSDYLDLVDVDGDGRKDLVYDHWGCSAGKGPALVVDALTGQKKLEINYRMQRIGHPQNAAIGRFDPSVSPAQIAICDKRNLIVLWDLATGKFLWKRDAPASLLSRGDWDGDGNDEVMAFALGANVDGMFSVWNGKGERLYAISFLPSPSKRTWSDKHNGGSWSHAMPGGHEGVRRQVDLDGNGRADVIMPFGAWHWGSDSILFLMEGPTRELLPPTAVSEAQQ